MRSRNPDETRERILEAAGQLFYRDGIRPVAMDMIAATAGLTKRTLYYHFDSKDDLVVAYLRHTSGRVCAALTKAGSRHGSDPMARLLGFFDDLAARLAHPKFRGCPFINAAAELSEADAARTAAAEHKESLRAWFEALLREFDVRDPVGLSEQFMLLTDGAIATWLVRRDPHAAQRAREAALILLHAARQGA